MSKRRRKATSTTHIVLRKNGPRTIPQGPQCFICDEVIAGKGVPLLMSCTPYSNTGLPTKIGQLMGDSFMVIVAVTDMLCRRCSSLVNHLDKLEVDLHQVKKALTGYLKVKYKLDDDFIEDIEKLSSMNVREEMTGVGGIGYAEDNPCIGPGEEEGAYTRVCPNKDVKPSISELKSKLLRPDEIKLEKRITASYADNKDKDRADCIVKNHPAGEEEDEEEEEEEEVVEVADDADTDCPERKRPLQSSASPPPLQPTYKCTYCSHSSSELEAFTAHLASHSKKVFYKCSECSRKFESQEEVESHVLESHGMPRVKYEVSPSERLPNPYSTPPHQLYGCGACRFRHYDEGTFQTHVESKHVKAEFFACKICFRKFKHKITLKKHVNTHRTFKCGLCSTTFQNKASLVHHVHQVHKVEIEEYSTEQRCDVKDADGLDGNIATAIGELRDDIKVESAKGQVNPSSIEEQSIIKEAEYDRVEILLEKMHSDTPMEVTADPLDGCAAESTKKEKNIKEEEEENVSEMDVFADEACTTETMRERGQGREEELAPPNEVKGYLEDSSNYLEESQSDAESLVKREEGEGDASKDGQLFTLMDDGTLVLEPPCLVKADGDALPKVQEQIFKEHHLLDEHKENDVAEANDVPAVSRKVYVCSICGLRTPLEPHMKRHFKCHIALQQKTYKCQICERVLTTHSNLKRHVALHERCTGGEVECKICFKKLTDRLTLKHHMEVKHLMAHQCSFCDQRFETKKLCQEHELSHPTLSCTFCGKLFLTEGRLKNHREVVHGDTNQLAAAAAPEKTYKCHICFKFLTTYHNLKRHLRNHEKCSGTVTCSLCSQELTDRLHLRRHVEERHPESHQCPFCNKVFNNKRSCKAHELSHPERSVHRCDLCEKVFLTEARLKRHKEVTHRDPHCRICGKEIANPTKLLDHERRHERHKEKFPCDQCPKVFRTPSGLKYHMSVHTGKYAVYCEICGKGLHSEVVLEEHKATHTKEVRYMCELCGRKFSSNSTYRMHRLWHDNPLPYKCNICDRKFKHTSILAVHKRRAHTGERPYKCPYCSLTFSVSSTLNKHVILHTKQYPFRCECCGKGFTTRTKIARHMAKVHDDHEMLDSQKKKKCEYKMVLMPSELPDAAAEAEVEVKGEEEVEEEEEDEAQRATLQVLQLQEVALDDNQAAIFTIFQPDLQVHEAPLQ